MKSALAKAADDCVAETGQPPPADWRMVRASLKARAPQLADVVGSRSIAEVVSETELRDQERKLRGIPDLLLLGDEVILLDLKTQQFDGDELPEAVQFQLNIYSHLVNVQYGSRPDRVEVFSLHRGRIPVAVTQESINNTLAEVDAGRACDQTDAHPEPDLCRYCDRRLICEPHWQALQGWLDPDALEGEIIDIEVATNGQAALRVQLADGATWVNRIPASELKGSQPGQRVRLVRLRKPRPTDDGQFDGWGWQRVSALQLQPPGYMRTSQRLPA